MSLAVVLATADRIVAASDSRAMNEARTEYSDIANKVDVDRDGRISADARVVSWSVGSVRPSTVLSGHSQAAARSRPDAPSRNTRRTT